MFDCLKKTGDGSGYLQAPRQISIDPLSVRSLPLTLIASGTQIGTGTGFIVLVGNYPYLVSNFHVLAGRHAETLQPLDRFARIPDTVHILHHRKNMLGSWIAKEERLVGPEGKSRLLVNTCGGVDVAVLPLDSLDDVAVYETDLSLRSTPIRLQPAEQVSIIGFPFGNASWGGFPIWKSGMIASDFDLDYMGKPQFLVDATTRPGMSGSPVYARRYGSYQNESFTTVLTMGTSDRFLGIYAGRIDEQSEIGRVWRPSTIIEILERQITR